MTNFTTKIQKMQMIFAIFLPLIFSAHANADQISVFVSILPQAEFVKRIGGDLVKVETLVKPGQSPTTYEPTPKQIIKLSNAEIYFRIGAPFESAFIPKIAKTCEKLKIIDTRKKIKLRPIDEHHVRKNHHHGRFDPHIWLSPKLVKIQAKAICETLINFAPQHADHFRKNLEIFCNDLEKTDKQISKLLDPFKGEKFYVFHPAFGYFADAYGLKQIAIETEGKDPTPKKLAQLITQAKADGVRVIFVQKQFSQKNAKTIAKSIGGIVIEVDPLAKNYCNNMIKFAKQIRKGLQK